MIRNVDKIFDTFSKLCTLHLEKVWMYHQIQKDFYISSEVVMRIIET